MNEYRCTRNKPYTNPRCFGFTDLVARSGHYVAAETEAEAIARMTELYPDDDAGFTVQLWKTDCPVCRGKGQQIPYSLMLDGSVTKGDPVICDLCQGAGRVEVTELETYRVSGLIIGDGETILNRGKFVQSWLLC